MEQRIITVLRKPEFITFPRTVTFWNELAQVEIEATWSTTYTAVLLAHNSYDLRAANVISCIFWMLFFFFWTLILLFALMKPGKAGASLSKVRKEAGWMLEEEAALARCCHCRGSRKGLRCRQVASRISSPAEVKARALQRAAGSPSLGARAAVRRGLCPRCIRLLLWGLPIYLLAAASWMCS